MFYFDHKLFIHKFFLQFMILMNEIYFYFAFGLCCFSIKIKRNERNYQTKQESENVLSIRLFFSDQQISHESNCGRAHSESLSGRFFELLSLCLLYSFIDSTTPCLKRLSASKETSGNISLRERKQTERQICFRLVGCSTSRNKKSVE